MDLKELELLVKEKIYKRLRKLNICAKNPILQEAFGAVTEAFNWERQKFQEEQNG